MRVLLVDDCEVSLDLLTHSLDEFDVSALVLARDGERALDFFKRQQFDLVIADWEMPNLDGLGLLKSIRKVDEMIPVIIVTAHASDENFLAAWSSGGTAFIGKPFDPVEFREVIIRSLSVYPQMVQAGQPVAYWRFSEARGRTTSGTISGRLVGKASLGKAGPRSSVYPLFDDKNNALTISSGTGYVRIADPGDDSPLDFGIGDSITLEAWVAPQSGRKGGFSYVIGKGRTWNKGFPRDNHNYALRLAGASGTAQISFLFRSAPTKTSKAGEYHRWTSNEGFVIGAGWHHVAVTYTFGKADSLRGYIDGKPVSGKWDMGGKTSAAPVVDNDDVWIGSAMGGNPGSTFRGAIDEVAVYRSVLTPDQIRQRFQAIRPKPYVTKLPLPEDGVLVEIQERISSANSWNFVAPKPVERYVEPAFGFVTVPQKYDDNGLRAERSNPFVVRSSAMVELPRGEYQFLIRSRSGARLSIDGKVQISNPFHKISGSAHGRVRKVAKIKEPHIRTLQTGDNENVVIFKSPGKRHRFQFEVFVGGKNKRPEMGETLVAYRRAGSKQPFRLLTPTTAKIPLTLEGWLDYLDQRREAILERNQQTRRKIALANAPIWKKRHAAAKRWVERQPLPTIPAVKSASGNPIDRFIGAKLQQAGIAPAAKTNDWQFLRRAALDTIGTIPPPELVEAFLRDSSSDRRAKYIERLLEHPGWADHWVGYWQDVLAENPNVLKPTLNNTGPFRWWIYESFRDNKPFDKFVTELVTMRGNKYVGAPSGFGMAAQNDVPMAAKAHVVGQAFLGVQMKCARCHDAPFHDIKQRQLFALAAMLKQGPQPVPKTSSIPLSDAAIESLIVKVTLKPGSKVAPQWPFPKIAPAKLPKEFATGVTDSRAQLAAIITAPTNRRFARVTVNRIWRRYMGQGIVEPVDDWENADPSHPELLDWLAREFVIHGYDIKHVARLILNSEAYQRVAVDEARMAKSKQKKPLFAAPVRRRLSAEQLLDSLFVAAGKRFNAGPLDMDLDGSRPYSTFLNLGKPRRAWEFTSLSNERDRPSLSMPYSQDFVSLLKTFGWRASRQDPLTVRDQDPTVLQSAILANGVIGRRITRLSDDGALTELAVKDQPLEKLIEGVYLRMLTRPPTKRERELFTELLRDGYESRVIDVDPSKVVRRFKRPTGVSWSNHLSEEANRIKIEMERLVQKGDPPSVRLQAGWRERMEDMIWALMNSPEFVFVP
eukprot:g26548.t1